MRKSLVLFVYCIYISFSYAQNVGIGTTTPGSGLELRGPGLGAQQRITDPASGNSLVLQGGAGTNLKVTGYNYGTGTAQPLYLSVDGANTLINPNGGSVGIGTTTPTSGYRLDVAGLLRSSGDYTHIVAKATGGTNAWARFYMQSSSQGWFIGTSQNYNGNQLYIGDETNSQIRLSIQPAGGPINMQGNATQDLGGYGLPKAMVYLNSNGTIGRCYNGLTGTTTGGCGFTSVHIGSGDYQINFPFDISSRFFAVSAEAACCAGPVSVTHKVFGTSVLNIGVLYKQVNVINPDPTDLPVMVIVY